MRESAPELPQGIARRAIAMTTILIVFGTRPEAIKLAPVIRELRSRADRIRTVVCVTAQHRQMLDQVLSLFGIAADHDLDVMEDNQRPAEVASLVLSGIHRILKTERPDWVVIQGDTTTVAATALAAYYERIKVAHVEAGLRTNDKWRPFPEEINRRLAGAVSDLHFAPTDWARRNLLEEGVAEEAIVVTGNPVIDALHWAAGMPFDPGRLPVPPAVLEDPQVKLLLVTAHRRENFGAPLEQICLALRKLLVRFAGRVHAVCPVHPNPNVSETVHRHLGDLRHVSLTPPLDYLTLVHLMKRCYFVLTDSGGLQEEAPALGIPVLVLREVTERPEAVQAGTVRIVGLSQDRILSETARLLESSSYYQQMVQAVNPYGDGRAAERIAQCLSGEAVLPFQPALAGLSGDLAQERPLR